jgi:hypothetical protein
MQSITDVTAIPIIEVVPIPEIYVGVNFITGIISAATPVLVFIMIVGVSVNPHTVSVSG